ncbi:unnamed protein product [Linum trigynum]
MVRREIAILILLVVTVGAINEDVVLKADHPQEIIGGWWTKAMVRITNTEGAMLKFHCKSKDDDLGVRVLGHRQSFQFEFNPNIFFKTLFYCSFEWQNGGGVHWFDIYVQTRDWLHCKICEWEVKQSGPCRRTPADGSYKCYNWGK